MECAHPPCDCSVVVGDLFCSPKCEHESSAGLLCACPHLECSGADRGQGDVTGVPLHVDG